MRVTEGEDPGQGENMSGGKRISRKRKLDDDDGSIAREARGRHGRRVEGRLGGEKQG